VIWSAMACWMAGSAASGATVRTYRSVLVTWLRAQTATPASGASTQPTTISKLATIVRHRCRATGPDPATPRSSPVRPGCWFMVSPLPGQSKTVITPIG
jgi:hypothetical protein